MVEVASTVDMGMRVSAAKAVMGRSPITITTVKSKLSSFCLFFCIVNSPFFLFFNTYVSDIYFYPVFLYANAHPPPYKLPMSAVIYSPETVP